MPEYDNNNSFVLFKNNKEGNEKRPDYTGTMTDAAGKEFPIAAWIRESKNGKKFMSGKISEPRDSEGGPQQNSAPAAEYQDEIPF